MKLKSPKGILLTAAAAAGVLLPLYGDPRQSPVTHPEWARMIMRALDMESVLVRGSSASLAFDTLSWRTSIDMPLERTLRNTGVTFLPGPPAQVKAQSDGGEVAYRFASGRRGDFRFRIKTSGTSAQPFAFEVTPEGETQPVRSLTLPVGMNAETGAVPLAAGVHSMSVGLPPGVALDNIEVIPPCINAIEPKSGWSPTAIARTAEVAVTALKAVDLEFELPPAASAIELGSDAFQPTMALALKASLKSDPGGFWLEGGAEGMQAAAYVDLPEAGLYTLSAYGLQGQGQSWTADACQKAVVCPNKEVPETPRWRPVMTADFSAGPHAFVMTLANGAAVQRIRFERKKDAAANYLSTIARLGLDLGEDRPIPRPLAVEAMEWIKRRRHATLESCGEILLRTDVLVAGLNVGGGNVTNPSTNPNPGPDPGTGPGPGGGPYVPLPSPNVPTTEPPATTPPTLPPVTTAPPASTLTPPPVTTVPLPPTTVTQPPASPIKD